MNYLRNIFIIATLQLLYGCLDNHKNGPLDKYKDIIANQIYNHQTPYERAHCNSKKQPTITSETIHTSDKEAYFSGFPNNPQKYLSGMYRVNLSAETLTIAFSNKGFFEEFSAPLIYDVKTQSVDGCKDIWIQPKHPDQSLREKTGKTEWIEIPSVRHKIRISGFNQDYEFSTDEKIDLSFAILNSQLTKNTVLKIICLDCELPKSEKTSIDESLSTTLKLSHDFRLNKITLIKSEKYEQYLDKKDELVKKEEALKSERQKQGVILDDFKIKCQSLGFKVGSKDFGDCVLELNDIK